MCGNDFAAEWMKKHAESVIDDAPSHRAKRVGFLLYPPYNKFGKVGGGGGGILESLCLSACVPSVHMSGFVLKISYELLNFL